MINLPQPQSQSQSQSQTNNDETDTNINIHEPKQYKIAIPQNLQHQNIFVEMYILSPVTNLIQTISQAHYDHNIIVQIKDQQGKLKVINKANMKPIIKSYVKVYCWIGSAKFHKDGYTDRRGMFDYISVSCDYLNQIQKFAILIHTANNGSLVKIVNAPSFDLSDNNNKNQPIINPFQNRFVGNKWKIMNNNNCK